MMHVHVARDMKCLMGIKRTSKSFLHALSTVKCSVVCVSYTCLLYIHVGIS